MFQEEDRGHPHLVETLDMTRDTQYVNVFILYWRLLEYNVTFKDRGLRWLSGRSSYSGASGPGFEPHDRRIVSLSKTL